MKTVSLFLLATAVSAQSNSTASCPSLPKGVNMGPGIPMNKADIPTGCSDFEILVARGTSEPNFKEGNGKFGIVVGDPVVGNLTKVLPNARGYPVQYPASASIGGISTGATDVVERLKKQDKECPNQKFALIGYSQGAAVMHSAGSKIPENIQKKIVALIMFGDPSLRMGSLGGGKFPPELQSKLLQNCAVGDSVCDKGTCFFHHLQYIRQPWVDKSVNYLVAAFKGTPLPSVVSGTGLKNDGVGM